MNRVHSILSSRGAVRGFTIVELMVGLAIGLVLVAGLALMFANTSRSRTELGKSVEQIENGRYAIELLQDDISLAGFYGELPPAVTYTNTPDACATALGSPSGNGLGWDGAALSAPVPVMGLSPVTAAGLACLPNHLEGTPAMVLRRFNTEAVAPSAGVANTAYVQTSRCSSDPVSTPFVVSATAADFTLKTFKCNAVNNVRQYISRVYYLAECNECSLETDAAHKIPTLKMAELRATSSGREMAVVPLTEGVENIEFLYGFDTTGTGNADRFLPGLSGDAGAKDNTWENVVAVRLYLLSRTSEISPGFDDGGKTYDIGRSEPLGPFTDQYKRRVYTSTVRLSNVAGRREKPPLPTPPSSPASP